MRTKYKAFDIFQKFIRQVERQSGNKLKYLHTDLRKKFVKRAFEEFTA